MRAIDMLADSILGQIRRLAADHHVAATHVRVHPEDVYAARADAQLYAYAPTPDGQDMLFGLRVILSPVHLDGPVVEAHRTGLGTLEVWDLSGVRVWRDGEMTYSRSHNA